MSRAKVLVVEDDPLMAETILDSLEEAGYTVVGPAGTLAEALNLAHTDPFDIAILDYDLRGEPVIPLAWSLRRRRIPIVVFSGLDTTVLDHTLPSDCITVPKSRGLGRLMTALDGLAPPPGEPCALP